MRPYLAIVQDSFREALRSPVLWIVLALVTVLLVAIAPFGYHQVMTTSIAEYEVDDWEAFAKRWQADSQRLGSSPGKRLWSLLDPPLQQRIAQLKRPEGGNLESLGDYTGTLHDFRQGVNKLLERRDLYEASSWKGVALGTEGQLLAKSQLDSMTNDEVGRFNRVLVERAFPEFVADSPPASTVITYAVWDLQSPMPIRQEQFHRAIRSLVNTFNNWFIGGLGVLIAILITAPIVPRMFDQGQLHLLLSKPVSRSFLFIAQFLGGCAYITIVATYLVIGLCLILGWRFQLWDYRLLYLIPIYTFVFAVYYCVSALAGVIFRNTVVAIAMSMLFWLICFSLGTSKLSLEEMYIRKQRVNRIVPAGPELLVVNEQNMVYAWNADTTQWDNVFLSKEQKQLQAFAMLVPAMPPMVGPIYDDQRQEIIAVERGFGRAMEMTLGIGKPTQSWSHTPGVSPPIGTLAIFREPSGSILVAANLGLFRLQGDPLKASAPVKVLGVTLPLPSKSPFENAANDAKLILASPAAAALDPKTGHVAVYTRGKLTRLDLRSKGQFVIDKERVISTDESEAVSLAYAGGQILVARADGHLQIIAVGTLEDVSSEQPEPESSARFVAASPTGEQLAAVFHNGKLWIYDTTTRKWSRPRITGQGDISTATWSDQGELFVADRTNRVTVYQGADLKLERQYAPALSIQEIAYRYGLVPLYTIFPKPGEMYKTFEYLLSGQTTASGPGPRDDASLAQRPLHPWAPVWSGLAFIGVVLLVTCVYFERQEY
ncbi:MAG TPA: ABC transporter permease [Pirellulaceae bacterium]|nr:ABC transporter permease [Pirellulaceae bacterium]